MCPAEIVQTVHLFQGGGWRKQWEGQQWRAGRGSSSFVTSEQLHWSLNKCVKTEHLNNKKLNQISGIIHNTWTIIYQKSDEYLCKIFCWNCQKGRKQNIHQKTFENKLNKMKLWKLSMESEKWKHKIKPFEMLNVICSKVTIWK